jgi:Flp pilus assembly protein TadD
MGVPVVTLRGDRHAARVGASILTTVGLERCITAAPEQYLAIATGLAGDLPALAALRAGLRERLRTSPLCDGAGFARAVEATFRTMWRDWCATQRSDAAPAVGEGRAAADVDAAEASARRLFNAGDLDQAEPLLRGVIERAPNRAFAWFLLGRVRLAKGDVDVAIDFLRKALAVDPKLVPAYNDLGILLQNQGRLEEAEACYREAIARDGRLAESMTNLGVVLAARGRLADATAWYARAIAADSQMAPAHSNLGAALAKLDRPEEAETLHRRAIALKPDFADAHYNLGVALHDQGRFAEALACYDRAVALKPDFVDARWNRAFNLLLGGNYADGWREHEWRWRRKEQPPGSFAQPMWGGEPIAGRTILLHAEQGFGDTLQFMRYVPLVAARGARVVLRVQRAVFRLAAAFAGVAQVIRDDDVPPPFDLHCPLLSLPLAFGTTLDTVPAAVPYVEADTGAAARWRERLGSGLKVGLVWAGSPQHKNDRNRSVAFEHLAALFAVPGVRWFSLQVGERRADLAQAAPGAIADIADGLTDFADTAAAIAGLDLVISVDTAVAHLAGALAKPVWLMLPFVPDWRWLIGREDNPWYPTLRTFRPPRRGDWEAVVGKVAEALTRRAGEAAAPPRALAPAPDDAALA